MNTDRLMSSLEGRIINIVRSEMNILKQPNSRLENLITALRNDISELKSFVESIRGKLKVFQS